MNRRHYTVAHTLAACSAYTSYLSPTFAGWHKASQRSSAFLFICCATLCAPLETVYGGVDPCGVFAHRVDVSGRGQKSSGWTEMRAHAQRDGEWWWRANSTTRTKGRQHEYNRVASTSASCARCVRSGTRVSCVCGGGSRGM